MKLSPEAFWESIRTASKQPYLLWFGFIVYGLSFVMKALAWRWYLGQRITFSTSLISIWYGLLINHLSPVKAGEFFRAYIFREREDVDYLTALQSVAVMRVFDLFSLCVMIYIGLYWLSVPAHFSFWLLIGGSLAGGAAGMILFKLWPDVIRKQIRFFKATFFRLSTMPVFLLVFLSWGMEAALIWSVAEALGQPVEWAKAIWINSVTVAGQVFQVTPGGLASYESVMALSFRSAGYFIEFGMTVAIITHGIKFLFSFIAGAAACILHPLSLKKVFRLYKERKR